MKRFLALFLIIFCCGLQLVHAQSCPAGKVWMTGIVANGTNSTDNLCFYTNTSHYYAAGSQCIYTAAELADQQIFPGSDISMVAISGASNDVCTAAGVRIYMAETPLATFSSFADSIPYSQMQLVFSRDSVTFTQGWNPMVLDSAFHYTGTGNLVVAITRQGTFSHVIAFHYQTGGRNIRYYQVSATSNMSKVMGTGRTRLLLGACVADTHCFTPRNLAASSTTGTLTATWTGFSNQYEVAMGPAGFDIDSANWLQMAVTSDTAYTFTNLNSGTSYDIYVRGVCPVTVSPWTPVLTFRTQCVSMPLPYSCNFDTSDELDSCWILKGNYSQWKNTNPYSSSGSIMVSDALAVLPPLQGPLANKHLRFAIFGPSELDVRIGIVSAESNYQTFIPYDTVRVAYSTNHSIPCIVETNFDRYTGPDGRIAIRYDSPNYVSYIDSILVDTIPGCLMTYIPTADSITTHSVRLHWGVRQGAAAYQVELKHSQTGDLRYYTTASTSLAVDSLLHSSVYYFRTRAICADGDTSRWTTDNVFCTECLPIDFFPYQSEMSANSYSAPRCWETMVDTLGHYVYYMMPEIDTAHFFMDQMKLSIYYYSIGNDFKAGVIEGTDLSTFIPIKNLPASGGGYTETMHYNTLRSGSRFAFRDTMPYDLSNVTSAVMAGLSYEPCFPAYSLSATEITDTSVTLSWSDYRAPSQWVVDYAANGQTYQAVASTNPYTLTSLQPVTNYTISVRALCGVGDTSISSNTVSLRTLPDSLHAFTRVELGGIAENSKYVPVNRYYRHSWTQSIYAPEDIDVRGRIDTIWFRYQNRGSSYTDTLAQLYLGHAPHSAALSDTDWVPMDSLVLVKQSGLIGSSSGWYSIVLDSAFNYDGHSPLAVVFARSSSTYSSNQAHYTFATNYGASLSRYSDDSASYAHYPNGVAGVRSNMLATVRFSFYQTLPTCPHVEDLHIHDIDDHDIAISWTEAGSATEWQVHVTDSEGMLDTTLLASENPFTVHSLTSEHTYTFQVRPICGAGDTGFYFSQCSHKLVTCPPPTYVQAMHVQDSSAMIGWQENGDATLWVVDYIEGDTPQQLITATRPVTLTGLLPATHYQVSVRAICSVGDTSVADTASFTTLANLDDVHTRIATGTENSSGTDFYPIYSYYNHSWTQMIYTADQIGQAGYIDTLWFKCSSVGTATTFDTLVSFYMAHTSLSTMPSSSAAWVPEADLQLVYRHPTASATQTGWFAIPLDTPFYYNGTDNLALVCSFHGLYSTGWKYYYRTKSNSVAVIRSDSDYSCGEYPGARNPNYVEAKQPLMELSMTIRYRDECLAPHNLTVSPVPNQAVAEIDWVDVSDNTAWQLVYSSADQTDTLTVTQHPYTLQVPTPGKEYTVQVRSICDSDYYSAWATAPATMVGLVMVPQSGADSIATCDIVVADWGGLSNRPEAGNGTLTLYPATPGALMHLSGKVHCASANMTLRVYDGTSTSDSLLAQYNNTCTDSVDLFSTTGPLTLQLVVSSTPYGSNIEGLELRAQCFTTSCDIPRYLMVDNITLHSADISWTALFGATNFEVRYAPTGQPFGPVNLMVSGYTQTTLIGLANNTEYTVQVRTMCPGGDYSDWQTIVFSTECGLIDSIPFVDDFESYTVNLLPDCWHQSGTNAKVASGIGRNSGKALRIGEVSWSTTTIATTRIDRQAIDLSDADLHLWARYTGYDSRTLVLGLMTDPANPSTFTPFDTLGVTSSYTEYIIPLSQCASAGEYLAFRTSGFTYGSSDYLCIDELALVEHQCTPPVAIQAGHTLNADSIAVSWTDPSPINSAWEFAYGLTGFDPDTCTTTQVVTETRAVMRNLTPNTDYHMYVRSLCSNGLPSDWYGPQTLTKVGQHWLQHGTDTVTTCSGHIYDLGGPSGPYYSGYNDTLVIRPAIQDNLITISGTGETSSSDTIILYEGEGTDGLLLGRWYGYNFSFGPVTSNTGAITLVLSTLVYPNMREGFDLTVTCQEPAGCRKPGNVHVLNLYDTTATVHWRNYGSFGAPVYNIAYGPSATFDTADATTYQLITGVVDTFCLLSALQPSTEYAVSVQAQCDGSSYSPWTLPVAFSTRCAAVSTLPYVEDFEGYTNINQMTCWNFFGMGAAAAPWLSGGTGTTSQYLFMNRWDDSYSFAVLPLIATPVQNLKVSFSMRAWGGGAVEKGNIQVGVLETIGDRSSFTPVQVFYPTGHDWQQYTVYLNGYTGNGRHIAIYTPEPSGNDQADALIDSVVVSLIESCPPVQHLTLDTVAHAMATFHWTEAGTATQWKAECCAYGVPQGSGMVQMVTAPTATFVGLHPNSQYTVYVSPACDSTALVSLGFETQCASVELLPYAENFDTYADYELPACWQEVRRATYNSNFYPRVMDHTLQLDNRAAVATPRLFAPANMLQVEFDVKCSHPNPAYLAVGFLSDSGTFYPVDSLQVTGGVYYHFAIPFSTLAITEVGRVMFRQSSPFWSQVNIIDNLVITSDTTDTTPQLRYYAANVYSNNPAWGTVTMTCDDTTAHPAGYFLEGSNICFAAAPVPQGQEGMQSRFVSWNDGDTANPRCFTLTQDTALMAIFALDTVRHQARVVSNNPVAGEAWITLPDADMHSAEGFFAHGAQLQFYAQANNLGDSMQARFLSWNDGDTANPRTLLLTADTLLTALFAIDTLQDTSHIGIRGVQSPLQVSLYPNPAHSTLTVSAPVGSLVEVYSLLGSRVATLRTRNEQTTIPVQTLPAGTYLLRVTAQQGTATLRFTRQ